MNVGEIGHRVGFRRDDGKWELGTVVKLERAGICSLYKVLGVRVLLDHNRGVSLYDKTNARRKDSFCDYLFALFRPSTRTCRAVILSLWARTGARSATGPPARPACAPVTA